MPPARSGRVRPPLGVHVAAAVALLSAAAIAGLLIGRVRAEDGRAVSASAPGLRADRLPAGIAGRRAPRIRLRDARGGWIDTRRLGGRPYAVTFLYAHCPDVCPVIAQDLRDAMASLGRDRRRVATVAVSVDPAGDTRAVVRGFLRRGSLPANFRYAIGTRAELAPTWRAYWSTPSVEGDPESVEHSAAIWLVDARGRLRGRYPAGAGVPPGDLARDFRALLATA
jgi:protein SCO1/2